MHQHDERVRDDDERSEERHAPWRAVSIIKFIHARSSDIKRRDRTDICNIICMLRGSSSPILHKQKPSFSHLFIIDWSTDQIGSTIPSSV